MKRNLVVSISLLLLAACAPTPTATSLPTVVPLPSMASTPTNVPMPTVTLVLTYTPTIAPTPRLRASLKQDAVLYSGPGNDGYDTLAQLKSGAVVYPLGNFMDFVKVGVETGGKKEGYVWKEALQVLPQGLNQLEAKDVPWQPVFITNIFVSPQTIFQGNDTILKNDYDVYYDVDGSPIILGSPFILTLKLQVKDATFGSIKLIGVPQSPGKLWWQGVRRMDIAVAGSSIQLGFRDGTTQDFKTTINLPLSVGQSFSLVFDDPQGKVFVVRDQDQREIRKIDVTTISGLQMKDGLFPERKMYLGVSSAPRSILTISSITLHEVPTGKMITTAGNQPGLRELAKRNGITTGTEWSLGQMKDKRYWDAMTNEYSTAILSGFSDPNFWRGRKDYDFQTLDRNIDFALQQGWRVRASHLVWGTGASDDSDAIPDWLRKGKFSRDEYIQILEEHVKTVVGHFRGRVTEWNIANEASSRFFCSGCDFWQEKIGSDYIEMAFRWAREADPNGILIFNDDGNESPADPRSQRIISKMYSTVKDLKAKGVPIDVVGMQMHLMLPWRNNQTPPKKEDVIKTMRMFADLGVSIYVTEFNMNLQGILGTVEERRQFGANLYRGMIEACLESGVCRSFSTWGISDANSRLICADKPYCLKLPNAEPLMFDTDYKPKPAYFAVRDALLSK